MKTITLKNIPEELHKRLKEQAALHHRSLNNEAISCLEATLKSRKVDTAALLKRARDLRGGTAVRLTEKDLHNYKNIGRS